MFGRVAAIAAAGIVVIAAAFAIGLVTLSNLSQVTTAVIVAASIAYFAVMLTSAKVQPVERVRVRAFIRCSSPMRFSGRCFSRSSPCSRSIPMSG